MRVISKLSILGAAIALSGCQTIQDRATISGFTSPTASGVIDGDLSNRVTGREIDADGDGFAYATGSISGEGLAAKAGLVAGTDVSTPPITGTATFSGVYELRRITGIFISSDSISGFPASETGQIALDANFADGSLTGTSGSLTVDGTMNGETLSGSVTYRGVEGPLRGLVGSDKTIGAFHGNDESLIYAGGFLANIE